MHDTILGRKIIIFWEKIMLVSSEIPKQGLITPYLMIGKQLPPTQVHLHINMLIALP